MTKDKSLEKIFLTQKPVFNSQDKGCYHGIFVAAKVRLFILLDELYCFQLPFQLLQKDILVIEYRFLEVCHSRSFYVCPSTNLCLHSM